MRLSRVCCVGLLVALATPARAIPVDDVANPRATTGRYVEDQARLLDAATVERLDSLCRAFEADTTGELAVVTVDNLAGLSVETYARRLFNRFGIGKRGKDNGVLILLARDDRKVRIEVGRGLVAVLTDDRAGQLLDAHAVPRFKQGDFAGGLAALTEAVDRLLRRDVELVRTGEATAAATGRPGEFPTHPDAAGKLGQRTGLPHIRVPVPPPPPPPPADAAVGLYLLVLVGFAVLSQGALTAIVFTRRSRAAGRRAMGHGVTFLVLLWLGGLVLAIALFQPTPLNFWLGFLVYAGLGTLVTFGQRYWRRVLRRRVQQYRRPCAQCGQPMDMVPEEEDDALLDAAEVAEEKVGGFDYEVWNCPACGASERLRVRFFGARACPKCKRRTRVRKRTVLQAPTYTSSGRGQVSERCHNPGCDYAWTRTYTISRKTRSSSSSSSGYRSSSSRSSSSRSSFGGGRSSGGGASRGW